MENWLDLHMHTMYSGDGELEPGILMERCFNAGIRAVAVADHNTVSGIPAARKRARELGMKFVPAMEFDCRFHGKVFHMLGYGINDQATEIQSISKKVHTEELRASQQYIDLVSRLDWEVNEEAIWQNATNGVVYGETIAKVLLSDPRNNGNELLKPYRPGGRRSDNPLVNFFWDFCAYGKPAYVEMQFISMPDAIKLIKGNGGAAVLAHPGANIQEDRETAESIIALGIDGIEAYSNYHSQHTRGFYADLAAEYNLLVTVGSDYHGRCKPAIKLGELFHPNPDKAVYRLNAIIASRGGEQLK